MSRQRQNKRDFGRDKAILKRSKILRGCISADTRQKKLRDIQNDRKRSKNITKYNIKH